MDEHILRRYGEVEETEESLEDREQAIEFLLHAINMTIYSSGENYAAALEQFFPQIQSLGHLIGADGVDDVSAFLRRHCCHYA